MFSARLRLGALWLSQSARSLADYCLRSFVVLQAARAGGNVASAAWHQVAPFAVLPFVLCAPFNGPLCTNWPPRRVMLLSALGCLLVAIASLFLLEPGNSPWIWCGVIALTATGHALYSPARYAALPPAAEATGYPLARLMGWMEGGSALGIVGGLLLGWRLRSTGDASSGLYTIGGLAIPEALIAVVGFNLVAWLFVWPASFVEKETAKPSWGQALAAFFRDTGRVLANPAVRPALLGLACLMALVTLTAGAIVAYSLQDDPLVAAPTWPWVFMSISLGLALGSAAVSLQKHPRRGMGFAGPACLLLACTLGAVVFGLITLTSAALLMGWLAGLVNAPFRTAYLASVPKDSRGNALAIMNAVVYLTMACASGLFFVATSQGWISPRSQIPVVAIIAALLGVAALVVFKRETVEQLFEFILWPLYRIK
ncbi:MAG TPA: MFS transporter, partial [Gemmataceae bacterium]|nr:MFS transporter [Gemmataceae bacterium]